jgi:dienelactone hydrolase
MAFADPEAVPVAFTAPDTELRYDLSVAADGEVARADLCRSWGPTRPTEDLPGAGFVLRVYRPDDLQGPAPAVVLVPGSTGLPAMAPTAALLAAHGYVAAVLGYMQERGLPPAFRQIPVESILGGLRAFAELPDVDDARMGVLAVSVGTVAALVALSGADAPTVGSVVVESPSHVVWQALADGGPPPKASMLARAGEDLPYVPIRGEKLLGQMLRTRLGRLVSHRPRSGALEMLPAYRAGLDESATVAAAAIPVEQIYAPVLAVGGEADAMWPSATMAQALIDRRRQQGGHIADRLLLLPGAGHFLRPPVTPTTVDRNDSLVSGGTPQASARGQRAAWDAVLGFLAEAHF